MCKNTSTYIPAAELKKFKTYYCFARRCSLGVESISFQIIN